MAETSFDLAVIGAGPGGYVAAIRAAQLGLKTAVVERDKVGGICLNWGCIPTKALLRSAELFSLFKRREEFGLLAENVSFDFNKVVKRSREVADRLSKGVDFLLKKNKVTKFDGAGRLLGKGEIEITDATGKSTAKVSAKNIIVATGARPRSLPNVKLDGKRVISSKEALVLEQVPKSLVIIGAGAIGVEFGYFYNTFGSKVILIEMMPQILPLEDKEVADVVAKSFKKSGIDLWTDSPVEKVSATAKGVTVAVKTKTGSKEVTGDLALVAVGVQGNSDGFGLEELGVKLDKSWITVDKKTYRTNVDGIYAIGDVIGPPWLAHVASAEGIAAVEGIVGESTEGVNYDNIPSCTYCQPQVASLGLTEEKAKEMGYEVRVGRFPFRANGKSLALGESEGFVKIIFGAKYGELLGVHIVGSDATEMLAELGVAKTLETTGQEIFKTIHAHPTLSEAIMEAAANAYGQAIHI